jgi:hypothetical protein
MTEINRRSLVSLVCGPVDLVESGESVDLVDLVDLCGFYKQFIADCCLGIQVELLPLLFPFSGYKQVSPSFLFQSIVPDRGRPAVASSVQKIA